MKDYIKITEEQIASIPVGHHFELSESIADWEDIPRGERRAFGRLFSRLCQQGRIANVALSGRGNDNHKIYVKLH